MPNLSLQDRRLVDQQLRSLPSRIDAAKQNEVGEMMGKLKEVPRDIAPLLSQFFFFVSWIIYRTLVLISSINLFL